MRNPTEYVKMKVLAAIDLAEGGTIRDRIRAVSQRAFEDEEGFEHRFTWRTIETWRTRYRKHGFTACESKPRSDRGTFRKIHPERILEAVEQAKSHLRPGFKVSELYRVCIEKALLQRENVAPNTFRRFIKKFELLKPEKEATSKHRLAFSKRFANEAWQVDTLFGPFVTHPNGHKVQTKLIAFIDDASRILCHGQFFFSEDISSLKTTLRAALYKRGIPQRIYADNGSIYKSQELVVICARIGTLLSHTPVRDGAAKGKIERFFRTCRDQFLNRQLDLESLEALNKAFILWAEEHYNNRVHSTLDMKPVDRFALDRARIQYLPPCEANDEAFYAEEERTVLADNTFKFKGKRYECPRHLASRKIMIRFDSEPSQTLQPIVYYKGERSGLAQPVDFIANDRFHAREKAGAR
jgi:transposase InsO family protein